MRHQVLNGTTEAWMPIRSTVPIPFLEFFQGTNMYQLIFVVKHHLYTMYIPCIYHVYTIYIPFIYHLYTQHWPEDARSAAKILLKVHTQTVACGGHSVVKGPHLR